MSEHLYSAKGVLAVSAALIALSHAVPAVPETLLAGLQFGSKPTLPLTTPGLVIGNTTVAEPHAVDDASTAFTLAVVCCAAVLLNCFRHPGPTEGKEAGEDAMDYGAEAFLGSVLGYKSGWIPFKYFWGSLNLLYALIAVRPTRAFSIFRFCRGVESISADSSGIVGLPGGDLRLHEPEGRRLRGVQARLDELRSGQVGNLLVHHAREGGGGGGGTATVSLTAPRRLKCRNLGLMFFYYEAWYCYLYRFNMGKQKFNQNHVSSSEHWSNVFWCVVGTVQVRQRSQQHQCDTCHDHDRCLST